MNTDSCESWEVFTGVNRGAARRHSGPGRRGWFSPSSAPITKMLTNFVLLSVLLCVALAGCGGGGSGQGASEMTGAALPGPHLYRNLQKTLPEVLGEQAASPDEGVVREFTVTRSFLLLPPNTFTRPHPPTWRVDDDSTLDSDVYLWPGTGGGHVMHIRGRAGLRGSYPFTEAAADWGAPGAGLTWPALYAGRHPSDVGIEHDILLAYADSGGSGEALAYTAYGWWAMAPVVGGGASDTSRTLSAHAGMSFGLETFPRDMPGSPAAPLTATWRGRATGHAQDADGRWVLEGDAVLEARLEGPSGAVTGGEIRNMRIAPLDPRSLQVDMDRAGEWHTIELLAASVEGNGYRGWISVRGAAEAGPRFATPTGRYEGAFYGPEAVETAGQWWLIEAYPDPSMGEMVVVGGFGAKRERP